MLTIYVNSFISYLIWFVHAVCNIIQKHWHKSHLYGVGERVSAIDEYNIGTGQSKKSRSVILSINLADPRKQHKYLSYTLYTTQNFTCLSNMNNIRGCNRTYI